ncbi:MAG: ABC transporter ATP-binding protein [Patescibacteria group bacterium]
MIETHNLIKTFKSGDVQTPVLKGIDFKARDGEWVAIMGRSGAGKSTFLYQMSLLDDPTDGKIIIDGHDTHTMSADEKMHFRLVKFGFVFQDYALLPELTALENVALPLLMRGHAKKEVYRVSAQAMKQAGLEHRLDNLPSQLSGGEQQRVSIVRAVAHKPKILFADEPTANLDNESARRIMSIFTELHKAGQTIIMVTHEEEYAKLAERIIHLDDGKIV